jgi:serine/threonine protein kinase
MGQVFAAQHTRIGRPVVVKLLHGHLQERVADRLRLEAQALAKLSHDNVVQVLDCAATAGGRPYLVMERLEGEELGKMLRTRPGGHLPIEQALDITRQTLAGLGHVHATGIVHRDVKPANIFVCRSGRVKLLDFGVVKLLERLTDVAPLAVATQQGATVGTPKYMAPEQVSGDAVDARTDLYAMGIVLYRMLTGVTPFEHCREITAMLMAHLAEPPAPPSTLASQPIPPRLDAIVLRAIAKSPAARFDDATQFAAELITLTPAYDALASELGFQPVDDTVVMGQKLELELDEDLDATRPAASPMRTDDTEPVVATELSFPALTEADLAPVAPPAQMELVPSPAQVAPLAPVVVAPPPAKPARDVWPRRIFWLAAAVVALLTMVLDFGLRGF